MRHEIIKVDNYLVVIDPKAPVEEGEICLFRAETDYIVKATTPIEEDLVIQDIYWKIIRHLPLEGSPALEGVPMLPPLPVDDAWNNGLEQELTKLPFTKHLDDGQYNDGQITGFELGANWGFDKAKEKYKFTEEDMKRLYEGTLQNVGTSIKQSDLPTWEQVKESLSRPKIPTHFEVLFTGSGMFVPALGDYVYQDDNWRGRYIYE